MDSIASLGKKGLRTWVEINTRALKHNYSVFRKLVGGKMLMAVAKSNAYGHGLVPFSKTMEKFGVDWIGVDSVKEAIRLRKEGIKKPILVLGYTMPENINLAVSKKISITISSFDGLNGLIALPSASKKKLKIHLKIDTGMSRQGFLSQDIHKVINFIESRSLTASIEGIYTHFAQAKSPNFSKSTMEQIQKFNEVVSAIKKVGLRPIVHASATSGSVLFPEAHFGMVRVGIGMYGLWPSEEVRAVYGPKIRLKPALYWKAVISEVKKVSMGNGVGYDFTEKLDRDSLLAISPVGYWHGYPRMLSSRGVVLVKGKRARVIGRVSMSMIVLDVTDIKGVKAGNEIILIGKGEKEEISAEEVASLCNTINYEIVTRINPLIRRIYI